MENLSLLSVATRLSWAAQRITTRAEDRAYSLLGLFGISMPILYGEGAEAAFFRLQSQIFHSFPDHTLLAWQMDDGNVLAHDTNLFAGSPDAFLTTRFLEPRSYEELGLGSHTNMIVQKPSAAPTRYSAFTHGMRLQLLMRYLFKDLEGRNVYDACLACRKPRDGRLFLVRVVAVRPGQFKRISSDLISLERNAMESGSWHLEDVYIFMPRRDLYPRKLGQVLDTANTVIQVACPIRPAEIALGRWPEETDRLEEQSVFTLTSTVSKNTRRALLSDPSFVPDEPTGQEQCVVVLVGHPLYNGYIAVIIAVIACRLKAAITTALPPSLSRGEPVENLKNFRWQDLSLSVIKRPLSGGRVLFVNAVITNNPAGRSVMENTSFLVDIGTT